jgi:hypothetical protein
MKEMVILNSKEQRRLMVLNRVEKGELWGRESYENRGAYLRSAIK